METVFTLQIIYSSFGKSLERSRYTDYDSILYDISYTHGLMVKKQKAKLQIFLKTP